MLGARQSTEAWFVWKQKKWGGPGDPVKVSVGKAKQVRDNHSPDDDRTEGKAGVRGVMGSAVAPNGLW